MVKLRKRFRSSRHTKDRKIAKRLREVIEIAEEAVEKRNLKKRKEERRAYLASLPRRRSRRQEAIQDTRSKDEAREQLEAQLVALAEADARRRVASLEDMLQRCTRERRQLSSPFYVAQAGLRGTQEDAVENVKHPAARILSVS